MKNTFLLLILTAAVSAAVLPVASSEAASPVIPEPDTFLVDTDSYPLPIQGFDVVREVGFGWVEVVPTATDDTTRLRGFAPLLVPNATLELHVEPLEPDQWGLENVGQDGGTPDADIDILDAWALTTGDPTKVIAVIDSGVDMDHPDLDGQLWINAADPVDGIDDDSNGYVDDVNGWDFVDDDNDPDDTFGHGTAVGTVAAAAVNAAGIAGVAPDARIMPLRVCQSSSCSLSAVVEAISYALDNGASVINLSLGTHTPYLPLEDAVAAANDAGVMVIASAGNDGTSNDDWPTYPANIEQPNVVAVAATDRDDFLADFASGASNYGTSVEIAAPGKELPAGIIGDWDTVSGTSFAAPMVSATVALILSARPTASVAEIRSMLLASVDIVPSLTGLVETGRLNAAGALREATGPIPEVIITPSSGTLPFTPQFDGSSSYDVNGSIVDHTWRFPDGTVQHGSIVEWTPDGPGLHAVTLEVTDDDAITRSTEAYVYANTPPIAEATVVNPVGWVPHLASLSSVTSSDDGGTIVSSTWSAPWSFVSGATVSFLVPLVGVHDVTLEVVDNDGVADTDVVTLYVGQDFVDTRTSPFRTDIAWMSATGITKGCNPPLNNRYCPDNTLTRGELAAFLARYLKLEATTDDFFDDDNGTTFEGDINRLAAAGVTKGCNPPLQSEFCADLEVTREQLAAMLARALSLPNTSTDYFTDDTGSIFESDINRLAEAGITSGCNPPANDEFCGGDPVLRSELAALMRRASA